ncbi:hypothetical protein AB0C60_33600, partial [Streptomyces sp. NPDC048845]
MPSSRRRESAPAPPGPIPAPARLPPIALSSRRCRSPPPSVRERVFMLPVVNELARKAGHTLACAEDAQRL